VDRSPNLAPATQTQHAEETELDVASAGRVPHEQAALISSSVPSLLTDLEPLTGAPTLRASKEIIADDAIGSSCYRRSALASRGILSPQIAFSGNANEKLVENVACATVQAATTLPFRFAATCKSKGKLRVSHSGAPGA
jgi:hypothetical protein